MGDDLDESAYGERSDEPRKPLLTPEQMAELEAAEQETIERWLRDDRQNL